MNVDADKKNFLCSLKEKFSHEWDPSFFQCFKNTFQAEGGSDKVLTLQNLYSLKSREVRTPVSPMPLLPRQIAARVLSLPTISHTIWPDLTFNMLTVSNFVRQLPFNKLHIILGPWVRKVNIACHSCHELIREFQTLYFKPSCTKCHRLPVVTTSRGFTMYLAEPQLPDVY